MMKRTMAGLMTLLMTSMAHGQFPTEYVAGEMDSVTPDIRLLDIYEGPSSDALLVVIQVTDFDVCGDCALSLPDNYGQQGQIDGEGHPHAYFQRLTEDIPDSRVSDVLCVFHSGNPTAEEIEPGIWQAECRRPEPGIYRVCVTAETNDHTQRVKASPRDFPPVDCAVFDLEVDD